MVLCAGYGSRLGDLTREIPKPMLPLCGRPILEYILAHLRSHHFDQVAVNLHFLPQAIRSHFGGGASLKIELTYAHEDRLLGTAGGFAQLAGGSGGDLAACTQALDEAIERATDLEAPYELAPALAVRSVLDPLIDGAQPPRYEDTHERAAADHQRAEAIFDSLGVTRAVVTWSSPISGELILRGRAMLGEWSGES